MRHVNNPPLIWIVVPLLLVHSCRADSHPPKQYGGALNIYYSDGITPDGNEGDWMELPFFKVFSDIEGNAPAPEDFQAGFSMAWDSTGLLFRFRIRDDVIYEDTGRFWKGDGIELFISPAKGSGDIIQISVRPSVELSSPEPAVQYFDHRKSPSLAGIPPSSVFYRTMIPGGYLIEGRVSLEPLGIRAGADSCEPAVQVYFNDADRKDDSSNFSLPWYPVRESYRNPYAFNSLRLAGPRGRGSAESFPQEHGSTEAGSTKSLPQEHGSPVSAREIGLEIRPFILDDRRLMIKLLSEDWAEDHTIRVALGSQEKKIKLRPEREGLYSKTLDQPLDHFPDPDLRIGVYRDDSLFFSIDRVLLQRVYRDMEEPYPFSTDIRIFEIRDHFSPPPTRPVLFVGSSTFTRWNGILDDLPGHPIINRGFGGSKMEDLNHYFDRIVLPYRPARIFVYEGDNDIAGGYSPERFIRDCRAFIASCEEDLPETDIYFLSIKPSPSRFRHWEEMSLANHMLAGLCTQKEKLHFIDISEVILNYRGRPDPELFVSDSLHFNEKGYEALAGILNPILNH